MLALWLLLSALPALDLANIEELSLSDLLDPKLSLVTKSPLSSRDAPGIVSVIGREQIARSGARWLSDVLMWVPGFAFGVDVEGVIGVGVRGQWGHEGKVLLLLDGLEMNELLYSTPMVGEHIPAEHIERVEIIRGPGSAIYGGFAELAVINVVTRTPKDLSGGAIAAYYGQLQGGFGGAGLSAAYGEDIAAIPGLSLAIKTFVGLHPRGNGAYTDFGGQSYDLTLATAGVQTTMVNVGGSYKNLEFRLVLDDHRVISRDGYTEILEMPENIRFLSLLSDLRWKAGLGDHLTLTPRLAYKWQQPWQVNDETSSAFYDKSVHRTVLGLTVTWDPIADLNLLAGVEGTVDYAELNDGRLIGFQALFANDQDRITYGNFAGYAQVFFQNFIANVTLGARFEQHSQVGSSFVPRVALTRVIDRVHFKALFSQAFRAPGVENLSLNPELKPERTNVVEAEAGVRITDRMQLTVNGFWGRIDRPIVYGYDTEQDIELYVNSTRTGTSGVEAEWRYQPSFGMFTASYSFYSAAGQNRVPDYAVLDSPGLLAGLPAHKATLTGAVELLPGRLRISSQAVFLSARSGYVGRDENGERARGSEPPVLLWNAAVVVSDVWTPGLEVGVGMYNLLGASYRLLQPYDGGHAPLRSNPRQLYVTLSYAFESQRTKTALR